MKKEFCGLFGAVGTEGAIRRCYYGLFALQHRGQESAGLAGVAGGRIRSHIGMGLVAEVFNDGRLRTLEPGVRHAVGHVRYSTTGGTTLANAQPLVVRCARGPIAVAHNGNLTNSKALRDELERSGSIFQGTADSEVILHLYARPSTDDLEHHLLQVLRRLEGAYSLLFLVPDAVIAARDPQGWRPLWLGRFPDGGYALASETCGLELSGADSVREVLPGEMLVVRENELRSHQIAAQTPAHCIFEHVYFARPDSTIFGDSVYGVRKSLGRRLAVEHPTDADVVIPIPDSGTPAALGYAEGSGIPFELGFVRSHYVGRTFIQPNSGDRKESVSLKLAAVRSVVEGKRVVVIDDSIVRGTTARSRIRLLFESGAREVHFRVSCPPLRHPCFFGIDFPTPEELVANQLDVAGIAREIGATTLGYLSLEGLLEAMSNPNGDYCTACMSGRYPVPIPEIQGKHVLEEGHR